MLTISNTSPILNLAIIGQLDLLRRQFGLLYIPAVVRDELRPDEDLPGSIAIQRALNDGWLSVVEAELS